MTDRDAHYWIEHLGLKAHPEGGYYRETYRSDLKISRSALGNSFSGERSASTAIYFLLAHKQCSSFHRIRSDELWHFHTGTSLLIHAIDAEGRLQSNRLGPDAVSGDDFQVTVPANCWFAAEVIDKSSFGLCSCTVSPGFDFKDFELASPVRLAEQFPQHKDLIHKMAGRDSNQS